MISRSDDGRLNLKIEDIRQIIQRQYHDLVELSGLKVTDEDVFGLNLLAASYLAGWYAEPDDRPAMALSTLYDLKTELTACFEQGRRDQQLFAAQRSQPQAGNKGERAQ